MTGVHQDVPPQVIRRLLQPQGQSPVEPFDHTGQVQHQPCWDDGYILRGRLVARGRPYQTVERPEGNGVPVCDEEGFAVYLCGPVVWLPEESAGGEEVSAGYVCRGDPVEEAFVVADLVAMTAFFEDIEGARDHLAVAFAVHAGEAEAHCAQAFVPVCVQHGLVGHSLCFGVVVGSGGRCALLSVLGEEVVGRAGHDLDGGGEDEGFDVLAGEGGVEEVLRAFDVDFVEVGVVGVSGADWGCGVDDEAGLDFGEQGLELFRRCEASAVVVGTLDLVAGWISTHDMDGRPGWVLNEGIDDVVSYESTSSYDKYRVFRHGGMNLLRRWRYQSDRLVNRSVVRNYM